MVSRSRSATVAWLLLPLALTTVAVSLGVLQAAGAELVASWIDNSHGVAMTRLERRLATASTFVAIADLAPGVIQYADVSVGTGTTYCYRVLAHDATGVSPYSDEVCATAATSPGTLSLAFTNPASGATVGGTTTVSLSVVASW